MFLSLQQYIVSRFSVQVAVVPAEESVASVGHRVRRECCPLEMCALIQNVR